MLNNTDNCVERIVTSSKGGSPEMLKILVGFKEGSRVQDPNDVNVIRGI